MMHRTQMADFSCHFPSARRDRGEHHQFYRRQLLNRAFLVAVLLVSAISASAQINFVEVQPASPTTLTPVSIVVRTATPCSQFPTISRTGSYIRIDVEPPCSAITPPELTATLFVGYLPAGIYTYEVYVDGIVQWSGDFLVAEAGAPFVPTLSFLGLCLTAAVLAVLGFIYIRRLT